MHYILAFCWRGTPKSFLHLASKQDSDVAIVQEQTVIDLVMVSTPRSTLSNLNVKKIYPGEYQAPQNLNHIHFIFMDNNTFLKDGRFSNSRVLLFIKYTTEVIQF